MKEALIGIAFLPVALAWSGYALVNLWAWFIVPTFGLPALGFVQAMGVSMVAGFLTHQRQQYEGDEHIIKAIVHAMLYPALMLIVGGIVKLWM